MARIGHASPRAALIYQHATHDRDHAIAHALNGMIEATVLPGRGSPPGASAAGTAG